MKKFFITCLACLGMLTVNAEDVVTVTYDALTPGEAGEITVNIKADANIYSAYNFYMYVPTGMTFESKAKKVLSDGEVITDDNDMSYAWGAKTGDLGQLDGYDCYLVTGYDGKNECFDAATGGSLVVIKYTGGTFEPKSIILNTITLAGPNNVKKVIDKVTAIKGIKANASTQNGAVYNVAGQRIAEIQKGVNVVNGKKVIK